MAATPYLAATIGGRRHPVRSWREVSDAYRRTIAALNLGASVTPPLRVVDSDGIVIADVSYNGRVWCADTGRLLFDPLS